MLANRSLNDLALRRSLLVTEGDLHRSLIKAECESLRTRLDGLNAARARVTANKPLLVAGGALAGWLALRHRHQLSRWLPSALSVLRRVRAFNQK